MSGPPKRDRGAAMGMRAPSGDYDPTVTEQMQTAIEDLARKAGAAKRSAESARSAELSPYPDPNRWGTRMPQPTDRRPSPIAVEGKVGRGLDYAREDHTHSGQPYKAITGSMPSAADAAPDGTFCLAGAGGANQSMWVRMAGTWVCLTHVREAS